jgi:alkylhydroperoxidase/carboxymuconolactone decarboxylase family protein YurZ
MSQNDLHLQEPGDPAFVHILSLVRICALVGLRNESKLKLELQSALQQKTSLLLIREAILQTYLFAGYAATINAFLVLNQLVGDSTDFLREDNSSLEIWKKRGEKLCRQIYDDQFDKLTQNISLLHPDLAEWMICEGYGKVLARPFLSPRVRELLIVGMTAVLQVERQYFSHVKGALHVGATGAELRRVLQEVAADPHYKNILESLLSSQS